MTKKFLLLISILFLFNCGGGAGAAASIIASIIPEGCECATVEQADYGNGWVEISRLNGISDEDMNDMGENGEAMIALCSDYELLRWSTLDDEGNQIDRRTLIDCKAS